MRKINKIVVHCSASNWGDVEEITKWHKERGFRTIGYHFVVHNPYPKFQYYSERRPHFESDGLIAPGRPVDQEGAHVRGHNADSIGICIIGNKLFTSQQFRNLRSLLRVLMRQYKIPAQNVYGHYELDSGKTCPNIDMEIIRSTL